MAKRNISEQQRKVYRRRRIVALLIAVLLVAGLVWGIAAGVRSLNRWRGDNTSSTASNSARTAAPAPTPSSSASSSKRVSKKLPVKPSPKPTETKKASVPNCGSSNTELKLTAPEPTTTVGGYIEFTAVIAHKGTDSCLIDASNDSRVLVITSGDQTIWRSDSCPVDNRLLLMAQGDHDDQPLRWNANSSGAQCLSDQSLPRVNPGTYKAQLILKSNPKVTSEVIPLIVQ
ncbi:hypothetical protein KIMH_03770 [Bombiscardovia apis]|uniref:Uncharacterized protein n=1 Tax=Bombiscardovia apis TaxID=2932182 RepID=A0ABN6SE06_9BIFI|nr:hypothetical protein [Bombiscardovia apis]BDR54266.1 hypothetical protein KIMH_03770 [Bombiscardovia apis]